MVLQQAQLGHLVLWSEHCIKTDVWCPEYAAPSLRHTVCPLWRIASVLRTSPAHHRIHEDTEGGNSMISRLIRVSLRARSVNLAAEEQLRLSDPHQPPNPAPLHSPWRLRQGSLQAFPGCILGARKPAGIPVWAFRHPLWDFRLPRAGPRHLHARLPGVAGDGLFRLAEKPLAYMSSACR